MAEESTFFSKAGPKFGILSSYFCKYSFKRIKPKIREGGGLG
jgi:hypothetical protein